jgi:protein TonB
LDHRQGFLVSAVVHLTLLTLLVSWAPEESEVVADEPEARQTSRVFMPPAEVLRQMAPAPAPKPRVAAVPAPTPAATPATGKDRISVGAPSNLRQEGPLILRRDDDLTQVARGRPDAVPTPAATPAPIPESVARAGGGASEEREGRSGLRLPASGGPLPGGAEGSREDSGEPGALSSALRQLDRRVSAGELGLPDGTGRQMGALLFDPRGADFTRWVNHFKNEVYRNWLIPQGAFLGFGGEVKIEFTVHRNGSMTDVRMVSSSGTPSLDKAARGALLGSLLMPLPDDYAPPSVTMLVTFQYARG